MSSFALRREWLVVALLFVLMIVKGVLWSLAFPLWQGPDEDDHYAVIQFIGENGRLPNTADTILPDEITLSRALADVGRLDYNPEQRQGWSDGPLGLREAEFDALPFSSRTSTELGTTAKLMHATPLYYLIAAIPYRLIGYNQNLLVRMQLQRLLAVLVSSPIVVVAYLIARRLFPQDAGLRLTIPILVAFQPQLTQMTAVISVDGLFFVLYSLLIYLCLRVLRDGLDGKTTVFIGLTFAAAFLIKPTINGFVPLVALAVIYDWWRRKGERWRVVGTAAVMNAVILPPVAWWMARSWRINHDLFYFNPVVEGHRIIQNPFYDYQFLPHMLDYYQSVWGGLFVTWWAHFGWVDTALPPWVYTFLRGLTFLAILGLAWKLRVHSKTSLDFGRLEIGDWRLIASTLQSLVSQSNIVWLFLALTVLVPVVLLQVYDLTFWREYGNGRGLQGRYWLGTVIPMLTFFAVGLLAWLPARWRPAGHIALRVGMVALNFISLLGYMMPRYYL